MRSKLEPGCKAIIVGGVCKENHGKIVTCLNFIGKKHGCMGGDLWEVDTLLVRRKIISKKRDDDYVCKAQNLQRIDDDLKPETEETKEEMETES